MNRAEADFPRDREGRRASNRAAGAYSRRTSPAPSSATMPASSAAPYASSEGSGCRRSQSRNDAARRGCGAGSLPVSRRSAASEAVFRVFGGGDEQSADDTEGKDVPLHREL